MQTLVKTLDTYIEHNCDRFLGELITFCRQPSISTTGHGMRPMADMIVSRLARLGANPLLINVDDSYPYVFAEIGEGSRTLLIYNHYDVQPASREDGWSYDPFEPHICDGRLFARGVADNKANLLFRIQAVEAYQAVYGQLPLRVRFLIEGEEEIGSPHLPYFVQQHTDLVRADGCIWEGGRKGEQGRPELQLGLRGLLYVELSLQAPTREVHSSWANVVENPAHSLLQRLSQAVDSLTDVEGRPIFGDLLTELPSPSREDLEMLAAIPFDPVTIQGKHEVTLRPGLTGSETVRRLLFEPSCNICGLYVGYTGPGLKTVIPNKAVAKVDFRLPPGLTPDHVESRLREHLRTYGYGDIQVKRLGALHPAQTSPKAAIARIVRDAVYHVYDVEPVIYPLMPASGPMYDLCQAQGTPAITFGAGHAGDNVHGVNENIYLSDYFQAIRCFGEILQRFATSDEEILV